MSFIEIIAWPFGWVMWFFYNCLGENYVLSLFLFTVMVRLLLLPFAVRQRRSSAKMALLKPQVQAIQSEYKNNPQRVQEEIARLYEREHCKSEGGCTSLLLQLPILCGLYNVIYNPITHIFRVIDQPFIQNAILAFSNAVPSSAPQLGIIKIIQNPALIDTLGITDIAKADALRNAITAIPADVSGKLARMNLNFLGLNLGEVPQIGAWSVIVPILVALASLLVAVLPRLLERKDGGIKISGMKWVHLLTFITPVMLCCFAFTVPSGIGLYWIFSNLLACVQTIILHYIYAPVRFEKRYRPNTLLEVGS